MLKKIALFGLMSLSIMNTFAAPATESSIQKALKLTNVNDVVTQSIQSSRGALNSQAIQWVRDRTGHNVLTVQDNQAAQEIVQILQQNTDSFLKTINVEQISADVYRRYYTEEELQTYIKFLETPEGRSINRKLPLIAQDVSQEMIKKIQNDPNIKLKQQQSNQRVKDILSKLPKAQATNNMPAKSS